MSVGSTGSLKMRDYLAWRMAFGVTTPSTNTVVQPEYDDMRPPGVTNHLGRMVIPDLQIRTNEDFDESIRLIDAALEPAVASVMDMRPNAFILGISALSVWGGNAEWGDELKRRIRKVAGWEIPVALATDAVLEALKLHGVKRRIAIMEPYFPSIEPKMIGVFGAAGYEIVRYNHMRGKSPSTYSVLTAQDMIAAIKAVDGPDVEAIVQFGANLPMARLADEAERWLDKPVVSINVATYWHALRSNGITDKLYGFTSLFSKF
jgi:maleate isomerase